MANKCFIVYAILCFWIFMLQRSMLYFPSHHALSSPSLKAWNIGDRTIGWCREVDHPKVVWLMFHGNAGQACDRDYALGHVAPDSSFFVMEYPGYGQRPGAPSEDAFNQAAQEAFRELRSRYPETPIGVIGESIGSGPACTLVSETDPPAKLVLITPFDSLYHVASRRFWFLPVALLLSDRWDNVRELRDYPKAIEIYGARNDSVIPIRHARRLADAIPRARFFEINGDHNDWSLQGDLEFSVP